MKILVLSNLYPPYYIGGYELACKQIVEGFKNNGHGIIVLTSRYGVNKKIQEDGIIRQLHFSLTYNPWRANNPFYLAKIINKEIMLFKKVINSFLPDVIYIWSMYGLSKYLLLEAHEHNLPIVYDLNDGWLLENVKEPDDEWFFFWKKKCRYNGLNKLRNFLNRYFKKDNLRLKWDQKSLNIKYAFFNSYSLKNLYAKGDLNILNSEVIHLGVRTDIFYNQNISKKPNLMKLLYVGQIARHKGVHTIVEAIKRLKNEGINDFVFDIVGDGPISYLNYLKNRVLNYGLENYVKFLGKYPREHMPYIYNTHDVLIFSSIWEEPFALTVLEAMSCGIAVIGTQAGGSKEILEDRKNCLVFPPEDDFALAKQIKHLMANPKIREQISLNAENLIKEKFNLSLIIEKKECYLKNILKN